MRLKNIPKAKEIVPNHPLVIINPEAMKGQWNTSFSNDLPIYLEIGCGKGQFITKTANNNPHKNFIGIEQYESVLYLALEKACEVNSNNLKFLCVHAEYLLDYFQEGEISGIYLNFSDPWPKKRHAKRRLTSDRFLPIYHRILKPQSLIEMKTDNSDLYRFTLENIENNPDFELLLCTENLYQDPVMLEENVSTEYEDKFVAKGNPINKIIFMRK